MNEDGSSGSDPFGDEIREALGRNVWEDEAASGGADAGSWWLRDGFRVVEERGVAGCGGGVGSGGGESGGVGGGENVLDAMRLTGDEKAGLAAMQMAGRAGSPEWDFFLGAAPLGSSEGVIAAFLEQEASDLRIEREGSVALGSFGDGAAAKEKCNEGRDDHAEDLEGVGHTETKDKKKSRDSKTIGDLESCAEKLWERHTSHENITTVRQRIVQPAGINKPDSQAHKHDSPVRTPAEEEKIGRRLARKIRNRESAKRSAERKRQDIIHNEERLQSLTRTNADLALMVRTQIQVLEAIRTHLPTDMRRKIDETLQIVRQRESPECKDERSTTNR